MRKHTTLKAIVITHTHSQHTIYQRKIAATNMESHSRSRRHSRLCGLGVSHIKIHLPGSCLLMYRHLELQLPPVSPLTQPPSWVLSGTLTFRGRINFAFILPLKIAAHERLPKKMFVLGWKVTTINQSRTIIAIWKQLFWWANILRVYHFTPWNLNLVGFCFDNTLLSIPVRIRVFLCIGTNILYQLQHLFQSISCPCCSFKFYNAALFQTVSLFHIHFFTLDLHKNYQ